MHQSSHRCTRFWSPGARLEAYPRPAIKPLDAVSIGRPLRAELLAESDSRRGEIWTVEPVIFRVARIIERLSASRWVPGRVPAPKSERGKRDAVAEVPEGVGAIKKFDYLTTSEVEHTVATLAMGDQPIVCPGRRTLLLLLVLLLLLLLLLKLSVVSGFA